MSRKHRIVVLASTIAVILLAATSLTIAAASQPKSPDTNTSTFVARGPVDAVYVAANPDDFTTTSLTPVQIPGMSITFKVPKKATVVIHFTDEAGCLSTVSSPSHWCYATILVDGVEAAPATGADDAIDTSDGSGSYRWIGAARNGVAVVAKGTHTVKVVLAPRFAGDTAWSGENDLEVWVLRSRTEED